MFTNPIDIILVSVSFARIKFTEKQVCTVLKFSVEKPKVYMEALHSSVVLI